MNRVAKSIIWLFVFTIPWENVLTISGGGTLAKLIGLAAGGIGGIAALTTKKVRFHPFLWAGLLFIIWNWLSLLWSIDQELSLQRVLTYTQLWVMAWMVYQYADRNFLEFLLRAYVLGAWVAVAATIYSYMTGSELYYQRYAAEGFDPNDLSFYLSLAIPMASYLGLKASSISVKVLFLTYIPVSLFAIALTASRAGAIATAVALLYIPQSSTMLNWKWRMTAFLFLIFASTTLLTQVPIENYLRLASVIEETTTGNLNQRLEIWRMGLEAFVNHPIIGIGAGAFPATIPGTPTAPHNVFLAVAVEGGLIGLLLWLLISFYSLKGIFRLKSFERELWLFVGVILLLAWFSLNFEWRKASWLMMSLAASASSLRGLSKAIHLQKLRYEYNFHHYRPGLRRCRNPVGAPGRPA